MLKIKAFTFNPFAENTYVAYDDASLEGIVVDPGCYEPEECEELDIFIKKKKITITQLINTHGHIDHVLGNQFVKDTYKVKLGIHQLDEPVFKAVGSYASNYGFHQYSPATIDHYLKENDLVKVGKHTFEVIFAPGHAPGHIVLVNDEHKVILGGDVLFKDSIGRSDLPGGDHETLQKSIREKLFILADSMVVYPGHGPTTTLGYEKKYNPFCAIAKR